MSYDVDLTLTVNVAEVGSSVTGEVQRPPRPIDDKDPVRALRLSLYYETEGLGDQDRHVASSVELPVGDDGVLNSRFELPVPSQGPISYDGRLMRVVWAVEARLDVKLRRDLKVSRPVLVVPLGGLGLYDRPHPL